MARKSPQRPNAEQPKAAPKKAGAEAETVESGAGTAREKATADLSSKEADQSDGVTGDRSLWIDTKVDPIEVALPGGVGYTLRAYRMSNTLAATDIEGREEDEDPFAARAALEDEDEEVVILDEEFVALAEGEAAEDETAESDDESDDETSDGKAKSKKAAPAPDHEEDEEVVEEVPFFLTHRGKLLLFKSPESLVAFIRSGAPHDLADLDTWNELAERVQPADVAAGDEDSYELDLVVENLRGGYDTWDLPLLIRAGEIARDLGYALRLSPVLMAMSSGSPLDDLDEALRASASGGLGGFMGRRRLRRIGAQQASLGWRTIIGKISAAVDWRD